MFLEFVNFIVERGNLARTELIFWRTVSGISRRSVRMKFFTEVN